MYLQHSLPFSKYLTNCQMSFCRRHMFSGQDCRPSEMASLGHWKEKVKDTQSLWN
jgi:hypothetical protein